MQPQNMAIVIFFYVLIVVGVFFIILNIVRAYAKEGPVQLWAALIELFLIATILTWAASSGHLSTTPLLH